jgi:hypothetical protein
MIQKSRRVLIYGALFLAISGVLFASVNDNDGKEWRQIIETVGVSWNEVAQACPQRNGISPCTGMAGARNLLGWVWATDEQVIKLFSRFEPELLTSPTFPTISGMAQFFTASGFLSSFRPTLSVASNYFAHQSLSGLTSAFDDVTGLGGAARVGMGNTPVSIGGEFAAGLRVNPNEVDFNRGVFLWRDTGLHSGAAIAYDDSGVVPSPAGGTAVANVLANDWLGGARPTTATVDLTQVSSTHDGVTLDTFDGSVDVIHAQAGAYTLVYQICEHGNPANCDSATVTVTVKPYVIDAVNDAGTQSPSTGGTAIANVLVNDKLGVMPATVANVTLSQVSSASPGVTLDVSDGSVDLAQGTPLGTYALVYKICETANPANCDSATATVYVKPHDILAVNDFVRASSKKAATLIPSVLANDWFANSRGPTTAKVSLSLVSVTPATNKLTLDLSDGSVDLAAKIDSKTYKLVYRICEITSPANCSQATATIELTGSGTP